MGKIAEAARQVVKTMHKQQRQITRLELEIGRLHDENDALRETLERIRAVIGSRSKTNKGYYVSMPSEYCLLIDQMVAHALKKGEGAE